MSKLTRREVASMAHLTTEQLNVWWQAIGLSSDSRVKTGKNKGMIKMSALRKSDMVLAEIHRRRNVANNVEC